MTPWAASWPTRSWTFRTVWVHSHAATRHRQAARPPPESGPHRNPPTAFRCNRATVPWRAPWSTEPQSHGATRHRTHHHAQLHRPAPQRAPPCTASTTPAPHRSPQDPVREPLARAGRWGRTSDDDTAPLPRAAAFRGRRAYAGGTGEGDVRVRDLRDMYAGSPNWRVPSAYPVFSSGRTHLGGSLLNSRYAK